VVRDGYAGVVYDLDGTLVRLAVDWPAVRRSVAGVFRSDGRDPGEDSLWDLLERSAATERLRERVNETIAAHEREGARRSERLALADECVAVARDRPVGVVSLNAESACRVALETHALGDAVGVVVGRDTVSERKPAPAPLRVALDRLGVAPGNAVFVGDVARDRECAERAGVDFERVGGRTT